MTNNITQLHRAFGSYKLAQDFYLSVCSFFYEMDVNGQVFVDEFVDNYIGHVNNKSKRLSDTILETGFSRTMIQKSMNGVRHSRQYTTKTFFFDMMVEIQRICSKNADKTMLTKGSHDSYMQLFYKLGPSTKHLSAKSFLKHLIKRGIVRTYDKFSIQFISSIPNHHESGVRHSRQYTTTTFFFDIMVEIQRICSKNVDKTMLIKGSHDSYMQLFYKLGPSNNHLSAKSFLEHLIRRGIVRTYDKFSIQFISSIPNHHENTKDKMMDLFSLEIQRFTHTLIRNFKAKDEDEKNYQLTLVSKHIHPDKHDAVRLELKELARKHLNEYQQLLDAHEEATDLGKQLVEKSGAELGISTFIYNLNPSEE